MVFRCVTVSRKSLAVIFFTVLLVPASVSASYIRLGLNPGSLDAVTSRSFDVNLTYFNGGDEAASGIRALLVSPEGFSSPVAYVGSLAAGESRTIVFNVSVGPDVAPGTHQLVLLSRYSDSNAYPYSKVSAVQVKYMAAEAQTLRGGISPLEIVAGGGGVLELSVSNLDGRPHDVAVELYLPGEFVSEGRLKRVRVPARGVARLEYGVKAVSANPGSDYLAVAVMGYDDGGVRHSASSYGTVSITRAAAGVLPPWLPVILLGGLAAAFIYSRVKSN